MDVSRFVLESAAFTRATLAGKPARWLIFILLGLPWMVLSSLLESRKILDGNTIHWSLIPWEEAGLLIGMGLLCNFLMSGWVVRLLRDDPVPPEFDHPLLLCLDGMKVHTIPLVWLLVPSVLAFAQYSIAGSGTVSLSLAVPDPATIVVLILLAVQIVIVFIAIQYATIGAIRFARTGSIREAFAVLEIRKNLDHIGIVNYFIGLGIVTVIWMLFSLSLRGVSLVPYAGPVISLCLAPVPTVFCFRFIAHFCDEERLSAGEKAAGMGTVEARARLPARVLVPEFLSWLVILAVLVVLCFTPLVLVIGAIARFFP